MKKKLLVFAALLVLALVCACVASAADGVPEIVVNDGEETSITSVAGHAVNPATLEYIIRATCTENGLCRFECAEPAAETSHYHWVGIKPLGHDWASQSGVREWGNVKEEPTCTTDGYAVDVCNRCFIENDDVRRNIEKYPHVYDEGTEVPKGKEDLFHYEVVTPSTCVKNGEGWKVCVYGCGTRMPENEQKTHLLKLPLIPHDWTDWRPDIETNCARLGKSARTCIACGATQEVYENHPVKDQGVEIKIEQVQPYPNPDWPTATAALNLNPASQAALDAELAKLDAQDVAYELKKNWLDNCYTRKLTYTCPFCLGELGVHQDITFTLPTVAHIWRDVPEEFGAVPGVEEDGKSLAPTCTKDGYYLTLCKYDTKYDTTTNAHGHANEDQYQKEVIPALEHDWSEWRASEQFWKDGEVYTVYYRYCKRDFCGVVEQETAAGEPGVKEGLVKDDDGVWRYYVDGEVDEEFTDLVYYDGGYFWVVNGVVPADANGMTICPDGEAYFLSQGQVQRKTQWAEYNGEWFIIKNGKLDEVTGLMAYDGSRFAVESGRKLLVNGLWQDPNSGVWVYLAEGQLQDYTGNATYDGETFEVVHGYLKN